MVGFYTSKINRKITTLKNLLAGVYLTRLSPTEGRKRIAENNWGGIWQQMEDDGKVERAIKLWIPADKLIQVKSDRDIVIHKGKIYLKDYEYETVRLDQGGGGNSP